MDDQLLIVWKLLSSVGVGALIGAERGWHGRKEDEGDRVAGIRTFSLTGLLGGVWAAMIPHTGEWILGVVFVAFAALVIFSYINEIRTQEEDDIGITTEVALLLTYSLGAWAALGHQLEALGSAVAVMAILSMKPVLHQWLKKVEAEVVYAGIKLLVISLILLPLLPNKGYGPWDTLNPYWIWWMVVLISGLSFLGYVFVKYAGEGKGTIITAIIGGLASSTAVTISLSHFAKQYKKGNIRIFIAGVLVASIIMFIRVILEVSVVNQSLVSHVWGPLIVMVILTALCVIWLWMRADDEAASAGVNSSLDLGNPLQLPTALKFGALLAVILVLTTALEEWYGDRGVYLLALISGLMDVDAITLSLSKMAQQEIESGVATLGILIAVISNTLVKAGLFIFIAGWKKSLTILWMVFLVSAGGIGSFLLWP